MEKSDQVGLTSRTELRCITCGYDLRSLPTEQSCPECGTPIELSLHGDRLSQSDPAWVSRIARGQSLLVFGVRLCLIVMVCAFVIPLLLLLLVFVLAAGPGVNLPNWVFSVLFWSFGSALFIGVLVTTVGCALVTTQDPRDTLRESSISNRNVARRALFAMYGCFAVAFFAGLLPIMGTGARILAGTFILSVGTCFTIELVATLGWLAVLAARIPDQDLRSRTLKSARFFRWAIPIFILPFLIPTVFATRPAPATAGGALTGTGTLSSVTGCVFFVVTAAILIGSVRMYKDLRIYRTTFRRCATEANTTNA